MDRKLIKKLVEASKTKDRLDAKKILKIAKLLKRNELKEYVFLLKRAKARQEVIVETFDKLTPKSLKDLQRKYKGKDIIFKKRDDIIGGLRINALDTIIDMTIKGSLNKIQKM